MNFDMMGGIDQRRQAANNQLRTSTKNSRNYCLIKIPTVKKIRVRVLLGFYSRRLHVIYEIDLCDRIHLIGSRVLRPFSILACL